jgi:hypothetical protein
VPNEEIELRLTGNTLVSRNHAVAVNNDPTPGEWNRQGVNPVAVRAGGNVFDGRPVAYLHHSPALLPPKEADALLARLLAWRDRDNLYETGGPRGFWGTNADKGAHPPRTLVDWKRFWGDPEATCREGRVLYQGGDLPARLADAPEKLGPEDFRLRPDSAGYQSGKDKKDLGADVDLVGPGPAYERWKKTSDYQQWLQETGQVRAPAPPAERGAFVLLAAGVERRFDTLADAVRGSADGDTVEVRGNGPFVSPPVDLGDRALTIRAGAGFRPILRLVPGVAPDDYLLKTEGPLVLEGLEIREASKERSRPALVGRCLLYSAGDILSLGGCRLLREEPARDGLGLVMAHSRISLRNCSFCNPNGSMVEFGNDLPVTCAVENCVGIANGPLMYVHYGDKSNRVSATVQRNTLHCIHALMVGLSTAPDGPTARPAEARGLVGFEVSSNVFNLKSGTLTFGQFGPYSERKHWPGIKEAWAVVGPLAGWSGRGNVFPPGRRLIHWYEERGCKFHPLGPADLKGWENSWGRTDRDLTGPVKCVGGDLLMRIGRGADQLAVEDFRLRPDSAGYRADKDGKDLGADVDLVGPGPAYERWKKTPDYQQWLKETAQPKE